MTTAAPPAEARTRFLDKRENLGLGAALIALIGLVVILVGRNRLGLVGAGAGAAASTLAIIVLWRSTPARLRLVKLIAPAAVAIIAFAATYHIWAQRHAAPPAATYGNYQPTVPAAGTKSVSPTLTQAERDLLRRGEEADKELMGNQQTPVLVGSNRNNR